MTIDESLRKSHPQKFWLKSISYFLYYIGAGSCWYEDQQISEVQKWTYVVWCLISNSYVFGVALVQYLSNFIPDLTLKEEADIRQFSFGNTSIAVKMIMFYVQKKRIRAFLERFFEKYREFSSVHLERSSVRRAFKYCCALSSLIYLTLVFALVESLTAYVKHGTPIRIQQTVYPTSSTPRFLFYILRFFIDFHWFYAVSIMTGIDMICIMSLVFLGFRFKRLQTYFKSLSEVIFNNPEMESSDLGREFETKFIEGIKFHEETLWCARNLQLSFGCFYNFQIVESLFVIVSCLINVVTSSYEFADLMPKLFYFVGIVVITGSYMLSGGDVTNEADVVPTAIFQCGWELNRTRKRLRNLVVMALISSQRPVTVTAFGLVSLSYSNYLMILRHCYSFFAVMHK